MKIFGIKCPQCKDVIYSRTRHDEHKCSCGNIFVDGGQGYLRYGYTYNADKSVKNCGTPEIVHLNLKATKEQLYEDWNKHLDIYGIIKGIKK